MSKKLVFSHIPKTGGMAIANHLNKNNIPFINLGHLYYSTDTSVLDSSTHYRFCVIRDPYSRYISAMNYILNTDNHHRMEGVIRSLMGKFNRKIDLDFIHLIDDALMQCVYILNPQYEYFIKYNFNYVHIYEKGFESLFSRINSDVGLSIPTTNIAIFNKVKTTFKTEYLTDTQKAEIRKKYEKDFELYEKYCKT